ncbi:S locus-related glycoprotein 1 binding pollen coat [Corchorus olitorius]|uniref:S locus-related glycoprotein 1 binding pollen coat n=1 Tax=Corchorus olitorius TaxID=93759 RepID=A0A1R3J168_9ROSI|nr:S locus-related glycoprotein 1 binding pollen coat [Corchorus olitorius]
MKTLSFSAIFLLVLFISAGNESMTVNAIGSCTVVGHGGGCEINECFNSCRAKHGQTAHGFCYTITTIDDTCVCRYPC